MNDLSNLDYNSLDPLYAFLNEKVGALPGWLEHYGAVFTMRLLDWQEKNLQPASLLEIGVFQAKYFSILLRSAAPRNELVVGIDTFQWVPEPIVRERIASTGIEARFTLIQTFSTLKTGRELLRDLGAEPRFISIDGSHECEDVVWDLRLAEEILSSTGLVSVDDFLNPVTLGVNDGVHRFFSVNRNLEPVLFTSNKLFLARAGYAAHYRTIVEEMLMTDHREPKSEGFRTLLGQNRENVEQRLWGKKLLVVP